MAHYTPPTRPAGTKLTFDKYNADHQVHSDNANPSAHEGYSVSLGQMQIATSPGDVGSESLATSLAGELERLRHEIQSIKTVLQGSAVAQWYAQSFTSSILQPPLVTANLPAGFTLSAGAAQTVVSALPSLTTTANGLVLLNGVGLFINSNHHTTGFLNVILRWLRGVTPIGQFSVDVANLSSGNVLMPVPIPPWAEKPGAGPFTYSLTAEVVATGDATGTLQTAAALPGALYGTCLL